MLAVNPKTTHLLIRHQEIALKGKNRPEFERRLSKNISRCIGDSGTVNWASGRIVVQLKPDVLNNPDAAFKTLPDMIHKVAKISGICAVTPCTITKCDDLETLKAEALEWIQKDLEAAPKAQTFAVRARRVDKSFPLSSMDLEIAVGEKVHAQRSDLKLHLKNPDVKLKIEVRHKHALIYSNEQSGIRGLPMDGTQRVVCLLSGGIDSPVAAYELMRRGCSPVLVHFHSKPFTSEASISKVMRLGKILRQLSPLPIELWLIPLIDIQKAVRDVCNQRYRTVHYRRYMMRLAEELAVRQGAKALVTGDALGQVASQTLSNLQAIEEVTKLPVLRPLISLDKDQIVAKAQSLGTYETSIEPHEDSCTLFAPNAPTTQAKINQLIEEEQKIPSYELIFAALDRAEKILL